MAIANPFKVNTSFSDQSDHSKWNTLYLNGTAIPGLVQSVDPVIQVEYEIFDALTDNVAEYDLDGNRKNFITQAYVTPKTQTPKSVVFTLLIYTEEDFKSYTNIAKKLDKGIKFKLSHPQTDIWGLTSVYIDEITPGFPSMETGMELTISFIEAIDKPKHFIYDVNGGPTPGALVLDQGQKDFLVSKGNFAEKPKNTNGSPKKKTLGEKQ